MLMESSVDIGGKASYSLLSNKGMISNGNNLKH